MYKDLFDKITPEESFKIKTMKRMEETMNTKKKSLKRGAIMALAATLLLGVTAFATGVVVSRVSHSSSAPTYTALPTSSQLKQEFDFNAQLLNNFENGYTFKSGHLVENEEQDASGKTIVSYKALNCIYTKEDQSVDLNMDKSELQMSSNQVTLLDTYKEVKLYYTQYLNKCVAGDYEMTIQDKEDEAMGKYIFSYGIEKEDPINVQFLLWSHEGINYSFMGQDSNLTQQELITITKHF